MLCLMEQNHQPRAEHVEHHQIGMCCCDAVALLAIGSGIPGGKTDPLAEFDTRRPGVSPVSQSGSNGWLTGDGRIGRSSSEGEDDCKHSEHTLTIGEVWMFGNDQIPNASYPTPGQGLVLDSNGSLHQAVRQKTQGYEFSYTEFTGNVAITANAAATAQTVVTAPELVFDGVTAILIEFFANTAGTPLGAGAYMLGDIWDGSTDLGIVVQLVTPAAGSMQAPVLVRRRLTPTAGPHTFSIRGWVSAPTGTFYAGTGGAGAYLPGYIRITKV